jgi:sulfur-carrier protein
MHITVKLFGSYRVGRFKETVLVFAVGTTIDCLLQTLNFIGKPPGIVLLNGMPAVPETELHDRDTVALFPLVSGG